LARYYLTKRNLTSLMGEIDKIKTEEDLEKFLLNHGENIVDCLGEQVPTKCKFHQHFMCAIYHMKVL